MLVDKKIIDKYLKTIPPIDRTLKECLNVLLKGDLIKAANIAKEDPALMFYLKDTTKKPIYGFSKPITDPNQIFGILGLSSAKSIVEGFLFSKIMPKEFVVFKLNKESYGDFQDQMIARWAYILDKKNIANREKYTSLSALFSATVIFCDRLFADKKDLVEEIKIYSSEANYNSILKKLTGMNLFVIAQEVAKKWELDEGSIEILSNLASDKLGENKEMVELSKLLYILFFFVVSRPESIEAGLNGFIDFNTDFVGDIVMEFNELMEEYDSTNS